jgi:hypothetical protein
MALPLLTRHLVETKLRDYCARKLPAHVRHQVRLSFAIEGDRVTLNEERDALGRPGTWITARIAQFRFNPDSGLWTLYRTNVRSPDAWLPYLAARPTAHFESLLQAMDADRSGMFWR